LAREVLMARQRGRSPSERDRARTRLFWRTVIVMSVAVGVTLAGLYVAGHARRWWGHGHPPGSHGGTVVALIGEGGHYHAEGVVDGDGVLTLHTLSEDPGRPELVEAQLLTARVRPEGAAEERTVELMPLPRLSDDVGKTSRFAALLPQELRKPKLSVSVAEIAVAGARFSLALTVDGTGAHADGGGEELFATPGGKYTAEDVRANGRLTAPSKYAGFTTSHDLSPRPGEKSCPVSRFKASAACTWLVAGKVYEFCCPPCIAEFLHRAKERPQSVKEPEEYVAK
jgi:hypothetical protein